MVASASEPLSTADLVTKNCPAETFLVNPASTHTFPSFTPGRFSNFFFTFLHQVFPARVLCVLNERNKFWRTTGELFVEREVQLLAEFDCRTNETLLRGH